MLSKPPPAAPSWPDPAPDDIPACLARAAAMTARTVARAYNDALREAGLPIQQVSLLVAVERGRAATLTGLAGELALERTTLLRNLAPLQKAGLVTLERVGRAKTVRLTEAGGALLRRVRPHWDAAQRAFAREIGRDRILDILAAMTELRRTARRLAGPVPTSPPTRKALP